MRSFVLIAVLAVAVHARPEPPSGYNYNAPAPLPAPAPQPSFNQGFSSSGSGGYQSPSFGTINSGVSSSFGNGNSFAPQPQGQIVQKHIYVHVPPPEEEAQVFAQQQQFAQPRKHYKIIFIKAPSAPSISQQIAAAQALNEEKTLIYVLVKKPEDIEIPDAPAPAPIPVSKPEVYFIKYKTQKEGSGGAFGSALSQGSVFSGQQQGGYQSSGFDVPPPNPQATYGAPIKK